MIRKAAGVLGALLIALYPFLAWKGLSLFGTAPVAGLLAATALLRAAAVRDPMSLWAVLPALLLAGWGWLDDSESALSLYPVLMNLLGLILFAGSLRSVPMCERFARLVHPDLPEKGVRWCRGVTLVWCGFFIFNGGIAFLTVLAGDRDLWMLWNGCISYILMGLTALAEYILRVIRQRRQTAR